MPATESQLDAATEELVAIARDAAQAGAIVLLDYWKRGVEAGETKSTGTDMVSAADLASEAAIRAVLAARRPHDVVLGEEGGLAHADGTPLAGNDAGADGEVYGTGAVIAAREAAADSLVWICDPLDGTTNFLFGLRAWAVSVAVRDQAGVIVGVVADPLAGERFVAARGGLAQLERHDGSVVVLAPAGDRATALSTALVGTGFAYSAPVRKHQAQVIGGLIDQVRDVRRTGAAALDLCWAAAGRLDAYYERTVRPWDIAAGALLCEQVGLEVRYLPATDDVPDGICVTPAAITDQLWALVADGAQPVDGTVIDLVA